MKNWPAFKIERRLLSKLKPSPGNARTHSEGQIEQIAASIREWGWTQPILVDEKNGIIAGHGRATAAGKLGVKEVPVIVARGWSAGQKRAYMLADNQLAVNAGWDTDLLRVEIAGLRDIGFDLGLVGFDAPFLADLMSDKGGLTDPDEAPALPAVPATRTGDVWLLGDHRLVCGDCTEEAVVRACVGQEKPHLMVTDPPYGVEYDANWRNERFRKDGTPSDGRAIGKVKNDGQADWREAWALFTGDVAYVWSAGLRSRESVESLEASGFAIRAQIIWAKSRFVIGRGDYHFQHEPCWYGVRKGKKSHWCGERDKTTLWEFSHSKSETGHSTQKPVECMRRPIENNSKAGDAVYDPFVGSGTTLIAAQMTGRRALTIEIDPVYVDVAIQRWQNFTGNHATHEATGERFGEKAAA